MSSDTHVPPDPHWPAASPPRSLSRSVSTCSRSCSAWACWRSPWSRGSSPGRRTSSSRSAASCSAGRSCSRSSRAASPFVAPGLRITREQQPRLFELIEAEARAGGEAMPDDIYLTLDDNAAVAQVSRRRRVLVLGLPLLHILSERQLRGVLAHEFGHYSGGDTRLGPWIYRTRETIGRTVASLSADEDEEDWWAARLTRQPFIWYGRAFLRITAAISRRQEFAADRCAVGSVGRDAYVAAPRAQPRVRPRLRRLLGRRGRAGARARPAPADLRRLPALHRARSASSRPPTGTWRRSADVETDTYDSHPSLAERIAAVADLPAGEPDDSPCAFDALQDADRVEADLLRDLGLSLRQFEPVEWDAVGHDVYGTAGARVRRRSSTSLTEGDHVRARWPTRSSTSASSPTRSPTRDVEDRYALTAAVLGDAALVALEDAGWTISAEPAEPLGAVRGGRLPRPARGDRGDAGQRARRRRPGAPRSANWASPNSSWAPPAASLKDEGPGSTPGAFLTTCWTCCRGRTF